MEKSATVVVNTGEKKLKQAVLPFQVLSSSPKPSSEHAMKTLRSPLTNSGQQDVKDCNNITCIDISECSPKKVDSEVNSEDSNTRVDKENKMDISCEPPRKKMCVSSVDEKTSAYKNNEEDEVEVVLLNESPEKESSSVLKKRRDTCDDIVSKNPKKKRKLNDGDQVHESDLDPNILSNSPIPISAAETSKGMCTDMDESINSECEDASKSIAFDDSLKLTPPSRKLSLGPKKRTPKQLEKETEINKKREEKAKMKEEKEKKKLLEKEEKRKLKEEKEAQRKRELEEKEEQKRKIKEEKELQKKKEFKEKERKKQLQIDMKNEEKKRREEERKRKEEEMLRKKEEDVHLKQKYAKEAEAFSNFFTKVGMARKSETETKDTPFFKPFALKNGMRLAPRNRNPLDATRRSCLDEALVYQSACETYLTQLRCGEIKPGSSHNTWPLEEKYDDVTIIEDLDLPEATAISIPKPKLPRPKFLQFSENRRPPYWGTWRKKCLHVGPRKPFGQFKDFDYEVDSDDEWEEEEPGESLHGSDDEKDAEDEDDYEVDNDFFVPHGYLSEDEEQDEEEGFSPEKMKAKLKLLGEQFDKERNEKTRQLRPIVLGCVWFFEDVSSANPKVVALLSARAAVPWRDELPIEINVNEELDISEMIEGDSPPKAASKRVSFPTDGIPSLLRIVHGASVKKKIIANEFLSYWAKENPSLTLPSVALVSRKIKELAQWQTGQNVPNCWFVSQEIRDENGCSDLSLPNTWNFPVRRTSDAQDDARRITKYTKTLTEEERKQLLIAPEPEIEVIHVEERNSSAVKITKFTKILSEEERKSQLKVNSPIPPTPLIAKPSTDLQETFKKLNKFRAAPTEKKRVAILKSEPLSSQSPSPVEQVKKKVPILLSAPCGVEIVKESHEKLGSTEPSKQSPS